MTLWQRQKNWWSDVLWKPKKQLSLEQLKYQHQVLLRNPVVTEGNKHLIVETFRAITEILIWGDQNDSKVFDFFLEKNMQTYLLKTLSQNCGRFVCLQLLQTLSILFENIRNETSMYYLLSNNHINSIIVLKLDFSDEEVLAYYISFLKTLSFKLNKHTIHFFYNEHLRDFPLYTEAIKFFNHSESMVRIAVRTLTLNVYKVGSPTMLEYICNKTAAPYFSNLVWFIGNHIIELDECLLSQAHHLNRGRLEQLVAEHLDHLHYISDIISLGMDALNEIIADHFLNRLLIPLYVYSLTDMSPNAEGEESPRISSTIALFLLSQVFLIITHPDIVCQLAYLILTGDTSITLPPSLQQTPPGHRRSGSYSSVRAFVRPEASLESSLRRPVARGYVPAKPVNMKQVKSESTGARGEGKEGSSTESQSQLHKLLEEQEYVLIEASPSSEPTHQVCTPSTPATPPPKQPQHSDQQTPPPPICSPRHGVVVSSQMFLDALMSALCVRVDDAKCLFALSLLYAMIRNEGIHPRLLEAFSLKPLATEGEALQYNSELVSLLLCILDTATATGNSVRLVTLRLAIMLLQELLSTSSSTSSSTSCPSPSSALNDHHIALIESIYESAILQLRLFYMGPSDEIFLDMFEDEYNNEKSFNVNVPFLMMDASMLLPPTDTPLTGIEFTRRLPCGETERARKAMRVFFAIRALSQQVSGSEERELPLTMPSNSASVAEIVDLNNCDLVSCKVTSSEKSSQHFMVVTETEFLLVDPDKSRLGWGIVHFIAFLQDVDISPDPADSCALFITVHSHSVAQKRPALSAWFQFADHIRCVAARQCLTRSKDHLRLAKMTRIAKLLHLPTPPEPPPYAESTPTQSIPTPQLSRLPLDPPAHIAPTPSQFSTSVLHRVFMPPSSSPPSSQEIEMVNLLPSSHGNLTSSNTLQGGLLSPHLSSEEGLSPTVELDTRSLEAVLHLHKEGSKSRSPSCEPWQTGLRSQSCELLQTEPGLGSCEYSSRSRSCQSLQTNSTQDAAQSANINTDSGTPPSVTQPPEPILGELTVNGEGPPSESDTGSEQVETVTAEFV